MRARGASMYIKTKQIITFAKENGINYYCQMVDYAEENRRDWFAMLVGRNAEIFIEYFKSKSELLPIE